MIVRVACGDSAPFELRFEKDEVTIGRGHDNDVVIHMDMVARHHCALTRRDGQIAVVDRKSTGGTLVNGRKISAPTVVTEQDEILVGRCVVTVRAFAPNAPRS